MVFFTPSKVRFLLYNIFGDCRERKEVFSHESKMSMPKKKVIACRTNVGGHCQSFIGLYRYQAEGNQRSNEPLHCDLYEPAQEAPASFALSFQLASNCVLKPADRDSHLPEKWHLCR